MIKKVSLASVMMVFMACLTPVFAQQLKWKSASFNYKAYPSNPLPSKIQTYSVVLNGAYADHEGIKKKVLAAVAIPHLTRVDDLSTADAIIELHIPMLQIKGKVEKSETVETTKKYWFDVTYLLPTTLQMYNNEKTFYFRNEQLFQTPETASTDKASYNGLALENYLGESGIQFTCIEHALSQIKTSFAKNYVYVNSDFSQYLYTAKGKKINYDDLDQAFDILKDALKKTSIKGEPSDEQKTAIDQAIALWNTALKEADTNNPNVRINKDVYAGIHHNIALAQGWKCDFPSAWKNLEEGKRFSPGQQYDKNILALSTWLMDQEKRWMINHPEKFEQTIKGNWRITSIKTRGKLDLNKDGNPSSEMMEEYDDCKKMRFYNFQDGKKLNVKTGTENCLQEESHFWRIAKNSREERNYLLMDNEADYLTFSDAGSIFKIESITCNEFIAVGQALIDPSSDTTDDVRITFTRTSEEP